MSDSYQAIYDAVRSKISGGNISEAVAEIARSSLDTSWLQSHAQQEIYAVSHQWQRPSVLFRPRVFQDGDKWCALYGENLAEGVSGFGDTPDNACYEFDREWRGIRQPVNKDAVMKAVDGLLGAIKP